MAIPASQPLTYHQLVGMIRAAVIGVVLAILIFLYSANVFTIYHYMGHWSGTFLGQQLTLRVNWNSSAQLSVDNHQPRKFQWDYDAGQQRLRLLEPGTMLEKASAVVLADGTLNYTDPEAFGITITMKSHR